MIVPLDGFEVQEKTDHPNVPLLLAGGEDAHQVCQTNSVPQKHVVITILINML